MKFPKSLHADGWANHIDTTPSDKPAVKATGVGARLPGAKPASITPSLSTTPPLHAQAATAGSAAPRVAPAVHAPPRATALPPQRTTATAGWIAAGAGAAVIAGVAIWAMNRHVETTAVPPAVIGSAEAPTQVADATPVEPAPAEDRDSVAAAATPAPVEPAAERLGPPVTTVKPAPETARPVAQAPVPAPRPDLVERANPRTAALQPLQPPVTVAAAPAAVEPAPAASVQPGTTPLTLPPTAAGPAPVLPQAVTPQTATPPVATAAPDTAASAVAAPVTPPVAQAPAVPSPEDSGITMTVRSALAADATLAAVPIAVSTDHGVVKLEGQAPDAPTRQRATVVAASAAGVKAVDNRLTLPPATVVGQAPGSTL